jgi:hypothetical protein
MKANDTLTKPERLTDTLSPSVVLTLPFDPKMISRIQVDATLRDVLTRAVRELMNAYPGDIALPVINHLEDLATGLNYATHKRSIALFASAKTEKVLYLDEALEEQVVVDSGFRIRNLTIPRPNHVQYYVLLLSGRLSKMYLGDNHQLQLIKSNINRDMQPCAREEHEKGEPCIKPCVRKQGLLDKFLYHMDEALSVILDSHPLPVFVLAAGQVAETFARITRNDGHIGVYIHEHCLETTEEQLLDLLQPYLNDWSRIRQQMALKHITIAEHSGKLDFGIEAVTQSIRAGSGRLLIVERGFNQTSDTPSADFFIRDRVDALIEKLLERGGQVEWVDEGQLQNQAHIALVRYY